MPQFKAAEPLSKHLDDDALLKYMNKSFCCGLIGKAESGKTSLMVGFLSTSKKFKKVFHKIFVFMPNSSRSSMKNNVFDCLPDDQLFEGVTFENLKQVYNVLLENTNNGLRTLLVFDDVQSYLKNKEVEVNLLHIIANRRHLRCSMFIIAQNYVKIPLNIRKSFGDMFLFNINKEEWQKVYDENINIPKEEFTELIRTYKHIKKQEPNSFVYVHEYDKLFINWIELLFDSDCDEYDSDSEG